MPAIADRTLALEIHAQLATRALVDSVGDCRSALVARTRGERGEGVISAAIVVLIMAVLGAAMFVAYQKMFSQSTDTVNDKINSIANAPTT